MELFARAIIRHSTQSSQFSGNFTIIHLVVRLNIQLEYIFLLMHIRFLNPSCTEQILIWIQLMNIFLLPFPAYFYSKQYYFQFFRLTYCNLDSKKLKFVGSMGKLLVVGTKSHNVGNLRSSLGDQFLEKNQQISQKFLMIKHLFFKRPTQNP